MSRHIGSFFLNLPVGKGPHFTRYNVFVVFSKDLVKKYVLTS